MSEKYEDVEKRILEVSTKNIFPFDLPIGVYLVTKDGKFVKCNSKAREILKLPIEGSYVDTNISDFYYDLEVRKRLLEEVEAAEDKGRFLEKQIVRFKVNSETRWMQEH